MRRTTLTLSLFATLLLVSTAAAQRFDPLVGVYEFNGGRCEVVRDLRGGYLFTNENGGQAAFRYINRSQLAITVTLLWDANIIATTGRDRFGRVVIHFTNLGADAGVWVKVS